MFGNLVLEMAENWDEKIYKSMELSGIENCPILVVRSNHRIVDINLFCQK